MVVVVVICCGVAAAAYEVSELSELRPWLGSGWNRGESGARARTMDACGQAPGPELVLLTGQPNACSLANP